ncbi:MAG: DUF1573 domain-containing protein [Patescibacteria group bacterium]
MKSKTILLAIIVIFLVIGAGFYSYKQTAKNRNKNKDNPSLIQIEPSSFDFGKVKLGEVVKTEFTAKNLSSQNQKILSVTTSCGCTKAEIEKKNINPQETAKLLVTFNSGAHGKSGLGENDRRVYLKFKDQEIKEIEIKIHATVIE